MYFKTGRLGLKLIIKFIYKFWIWTNPKNEFGHVNAGEWRNGLRHGKGVNGIL